jgi:hypothetical protein
MIICPCSSCSNKKTNQNDNEIVNKVGMLPGRARLDTILLDIPHIQTYDTLYPVY